MQRVSSMQAVHNSITCRNSSASDGEPGFAADQSMPSLRKLARTDNWWDSKIPPVLAFCYASVLLYDVPPAAAARCIGLILFVGLCAGSYGHLINDLFDIDADRQTGQENSLSRLPSWQKYAACTVTLVLGFVPAALYRYSGLSLGLLAVEYALPTMYSAPPFRLKERGIAGVLCDTMGAHVVPCLYTISVLASAGTAHSSAGPWWWLLPACGATWSLCLGIKGIIIHEFQDRAGDMQAGVSTLATGLDRSRARVLVNRIYAGELLAFLALLVSLIRLSPLLAAGAALYVAMIRTKVTHDWNYYIHERGEDAAIEWWRFSHPFYECYLPLILALQCAWRSPSLAPLPVVQVLLFQGNFRRRVRELRRFAGQLRIWLICRGQLHLDDGAEVAVDRVNSGVVRLTIPRPGSQPWHARLTRPCGSVSAGRRCRLELEIRAERLRRVTVGLWQDHAPWNSLGLREELVLTDQWTVLDLGFAAAEDANRASLGIWLGAEDAPVEIRRFSLKPERAPRAAKRGNASPTRR
jgi:4-hydroxybenzoate polyprenyltransferase